MGPGDLRGKVIVVTGGAQGIGGATARLCAERGAQVVIADLNSQQGQSNADSICAAGHQAWFHQTDVSDPTSVQALMNAVRTRAQRLDVLICAAGVFKGAYQSPEELSIEDFESVLDVNVKGLFLCTKYAMPFFDEQNAGVILIVGSGAGVTGPSGSIAYGASKGGANGFGITLAHHIGKRNVRVNVLCPGNINTELKLGVVAAQAERQGKPVQRALAKAREELGDPQGVARVLAFLASDDAAYVRGTLFTR